MSFVDCLYALFCGLPGTAQGFDEGFRANSRSPRSELPGELDSLNSGSCPFLEAYETYAFINVCFGHDADYVLILIRGGRPRPAAFAARFWRALHT